ncbi:DUF6339 family protein [Saccharopolyspora sp. SCSIO 74807]|uniref:DUF6339 family protein n=1 Tax=Saccharopolyspora sp. SCSIO 74807 TaxID=3118084 RepID=UPI0030D1539C
MNRLYPRLLSGQAKPLFQEYRQLSIDELAGRVRSSHESAVFTATGGDRVSEEDLKSVRSRVLEVAEKAGFPERAGQRGNAEFDRELAEVLHCQAGLTPAEAASGDVWAFLALMVLPDVAFWRYPSPPRDRVLGTDLTRHVFGRMWWRAQLVYTPDSPSPYSALEGLGEAAFDQIYARRKALGGSPYLVKAILRVWSEVDFSALRGRATERDVLRDFLKRLLRLAPFVLFEALDEEHLDTELRTALHESIIAMVDSAGERSRGIPGIDAIFPVRNGDTGTLSDVLAEQTAWLRRKMSFSGEIAPKEGSDAEESRD